MLLSSSFFFFFFSQVSQPDARAPGGNYNFTQHASSAQDVRPAKASLTLSIPLYFHNF